MILTYEHIRSLQSWDGTPGYSDCSFGDTLWTAMDEAICLSECDVYSYKSDGEDDPFGALACCSLSSRRMSRISIYKILMCGTSIGRSNSNPDVWDRKHWRIHFELAAPSDMLTPFQTVGEAGNIWSFNYFLYNRKQKRVLYFSCRGVSKTAGELDRDKLCVRICIVQHLSCLTSWAVWNMQRCQALAVPLS